LLVKDNTSECNASRKKETTPKIHGDAIDIKENIQHSAKGMKIRFVGHRLVKQDKNRVIDLFEATPSRAIFLIAVAFSKRVQD